MMGQANMVGCKFGVATQITNTQPKALATHCHAHSLGLTVKVLAWMHSSYADDVDATALKGEFLAFSQIFKEKMRYFDDILRTLEETTSDTRLLFPNVITIIQLLLVNHATSVTPERSIYLARRFNCCSQTMPQVLPQKDRFM